MSETEHIEAMIAAKVKKPNCDACGENKWKVSPHTHFLSTVQNAKIVPGDGLPLHAMACTNCGFVRLFSSLVL